MQGYFLEYISLVIAESIIWPTNAPTITPVIVPKKFILVGFA